MPETAVICPSCGTVKRYSTANPPTNYGQHPSPAVPYPSPVAYPSAASSSAYPSPPASYYDVQPSVNINMNISMNPAYLPVTRSASTAAVPVEVLLNTFLGLYGVGWLMAGETTTGIILLLGSIFLYWPCIIFAIAITFGIGLCGIIPLVIGAIILNAVLLNNRVKRHNLRFQVPPPIPYR
jgi:hypothetical protein